MTLPHAAPAFGASEIVAVLGGRRVVRRLAGSYLELMELAAAGLPKATLTSLAAAATGSDADALRLRRLVIPDATWKRRVDVLSPDESDRTIRLARVVAFARYVWHGNREATIAFLNTPHSLLHGLTPLACANSDAGARAVEDVLMRLLHGVVG